MSEDMQFSPSSIGSIAIVKLSDEWHIGQVCKVDGSGLVRAVFSEGEVHSADTKARGVITPIIGEAIWNAVQHGRLAWRWKTPELLRETIRQKVRIV